MEFATPFPFLRVAVERATHDVRGLHELARVSLRSPGVDVVLVRLVRLPRSLRLGLMWADADAIVDCVADAIEAHRLAQDDVPEDDGLWRITRLTGPRAFADALVGDLAWVETADDSTGANARPVHFLLGSVGPVWRPLDREARENLARDKMRVIRGDEVEWGVPDRLCVARVRAGLSRAQAARQLGEDMISVGDLHDLEEGYVVATLPDLAKLADLYDVSVEWLRGEGAPSPMRADVERSGLSEPDKAKLGDMLDSVAPEIALQPRTCQTCQTTPILHVAEPGAGWVVMCPGCGEETGEHFESGDAIEAWNRDLIWLPPKSAAGAADGCVEWNRCAGVHSDAPTSEPSAPPSLHTLWGRAASLGYPRRPKRWWIEVQRAQEQGHDIGDVLREAARDLDAHERAVEDAPDVPVPASAPAMSALSHEDRVRLNEIRETIDFMQQRLAQGQGQLASAMCRLSLPMSLDLLRMAEHGVGNRLLAAERDERGVNRPDSDGWRDVSAITPEEWAAWRWWQWARHPSERSTVRSGHEAAPTHGQVRRVPVLEWHEMAGQEWIEARSVTQAMVDAWPVWECNRDEYGIQVLPSVGLAVGHLAGRWRPLRLSGMSTDHRTLGEIAASDMGAEHFERVDAWHRSSAGGWRPGNSQDIGDPTASIWIPSALLAARHRRSA